MLRFFSCTLAPAILSIMHELLQSSHERQVQWALLAMQIGLAVALWAMREECKDEHTKAERLRRGRRFWRKGQVAAGPGLLRRRPD